MHFLNSDNGRLEAFSDAVFAFAATLLVVSLEVPDDFAMLKEKLRGFLGFGISFFSLALLWKSHYDFFRRTDFIDNWIIALNMLLLFVILYFVFPLKFLVNLAINRQAMQAGDLAELFILYATGFGLIFFCLSMMYFQASKKEAPEKHPMLAFYFRHFMIFVGVSILGILLAVFSVGIRYGAPGFVFALLGPLCYLHGVKFGYGDKS